MKLFTPQQKKALSYAKDRRNHYGENDKSSRKNIPLRKAKQNRAYRHRVHQLLDAANPADEMDVTVHAVRMGNWTKCPDTPLRQSIEIGRTNAQRRYRRKMNRPWLLA